jgi:TetR/AcrR family transcriptional regulator, transcriptional repressor for nem operon
MRAGMSIVMSKAKRNLRAQPKRSTKPPRHARADAGDKDVTREALILAGLEEIAERGIDAPSLDAICARAGFTRGAFYVHFQGRDDFLVAVMDHVLGRFLSLLTTSNEGLSSTERAIRLFSREADSHSTAAHSRSALRFHHLMDACHRSATIGDRYRLLIAATGEQLVSGIEEDQKKGALRNDIAPRKIEALITALGLGVTAMIELGIPVDAKTVGETLLGLLAPAGLAPRKPAKRDSKVRSG